jgi:hypothetical protein
LQKFANKKKTLVVTQKIHCSKGFWGKQMQKSPHFDARNKVRNQIFQRQNEFLYTPRTGQDSKKFLSSYLTSIAKFGSFLSWTIASASYLTKFN